MPIWLTVSYVIVALLVLIGVNIMYSKKRKQKLEVEKQEVVAVEEDVVPLRKVEMETVTQNIEVQQIELQVEKTESQQDQPVEEIEKVKVQQVIVEQKVEIEKAEPEPVIPLELPKKQKTVKLTPAPSKVADQSNNPPVAIGKVLAVIVIGMFIEVLNQTIINVALPVLINDFSVATSTAEWLVTGFMLVNGILIPISAFLMERYGYRKLFLFSVITFTIGAFICAIATNFPMMMLGRIIDAFCAGIMMPLGMTVIMSSFAPEKRGSAMGMLGIGIILGPALGPAITGWVIDNYQWNYVFYGMTIISALNIILAWKWFKIDRPTTKTKIDYVSLILSSLAFGGILYGFSEAGSAGWGDIKVLVTLIGGFIFLALFTLRQLGLERPMLNVRVFKYPMYAFTVVINMFVTMSMFGALLLLPIYLQTVRGFTPLESGVLTLPGALMMGFMGPIAGKLMDKYGIRMLAIVGLSITTYASYEFTKLSSDTAYSVILVYYMIRSFGMGLLMMPIMTAGMNALPMKLIAHGTAMSNTMRQVAGSVGTAFLITIMTRQTNAHLSDYGNTITSGNVFINNDLHGMAQGFVASGMSPTGAGVMSHIMVYQEAAKESMIQGTNDAFLIATFISAFALFISLFLGKGKKAQEGKDKVYSH